MTQYFWRRWSLDYIHNLQIRSKWHTNEVNPSVGDSVIIKGENKNTLQWLLRRVLKYHSGSDGITRVLSFKNTSRYM